MIISVQKRGARESEREKQQSGSKSTTVLTRRGEEKREQIKTLIIPGTTEGHIYIQSPLCYTSGIVLINLRCVEKGTQ